MSVIRQLSTRIRYRSPWLAVREDEVEFPDGSRGTYSVVEKRDFALVLPFADRGFWLVEQYRYPLGRREWEFPQGGWPPGHAGSSGDSGRALAEAELREETGLRAGTMTHLGRLNAVPGYSPQRYDVWLAVDPSPGEPAREASEQDMRCAWFPEQEVRDMIGDGRIADAHSVAGLALLDLYRRRVVLSAGSET
jgi:8-oxo-dGTP pyrophosphatase MutT (NUDIX family)